MIEKNYIKVSALNNYIKLLFDDNTFLRKVYLKGEISNFKNHMSGHLYFTLKDEEGRISAIMFKSRTTELKFTPEDGKKVLVEGRISCYPAQGTYQIYVDNMEEDGLGNLYILYEELKRKLKQEGLFEESHKKRIPKYPQKIGIVTAPTGAAIKDILSTLKRRYPICETILFPALVQGVNAKEDIVRQIKRAENYDLDILIVGRGGGSIEDLWAFNEECVARTIYECKIPVISAVGHEIDYTISDFVADLRAPTPTGAAEMAVPTRKEVKEKIDSFHIQICHLINKIIQEKENNLKQIKNSYLLKNPNMLYDIKIQKLDQINEHITQFFIQYLKEKKQLLHQLESSYLLKNPQILYTNKLEKLKLVWENIQKNISYYLNQKEQVFNLQMNNLKLVNPLNLLEKGYTLIQKENQLIKDCNHLNINDIISIKMKNGSVNAIVKEINKDGKNI